jgi:PadR family transcriptional regulator PadR
MKCTRKCTYYGFCTALSNGHRPKPAGLVSRFDNWLSVRVVRLFKSSAPTRLLTAIVSLFYCVEQMPRGDLLGSLEHIVLLALIRLKSNGYGMTVRREIEERTGRNISIGAVYTTLERLQAKGYVSSLIGEPTAERGGRAKRLFRIEADGERALRASQEAIRKMTLGSVRRWRTT